MEANDISKADHNFAESETSVESPGSHTTENDLNTQSDEIARLKQRAEDNYNLYVRTLADAENSRKRLLKDLDSAKRYSLESLLKDMLPVLDGFEKALMTQNSKDSASNALLQGITIIQKQLLDVLEKQGLVGLPSEGKKFDPNFHQAIKRTESDEVVEETVECEYSKAYKIHDRLLRPAMVSVLVPKRDDSND